MIFSSNQLAGFYMNVALTWYGLIAVPKNCLKNKKSRSNSFKNILFVSTYSIYVSTYYLGKEYVTQNSW